MSSRSLRTPSELFNRAGKLPLLVILSLGLGGVAWAQPPSAPAVPKLTEREKADMPKAADKDKADPNKPRIKVSDQMLVDMHVKDESITNVLELLHIQSSKNIIASKSVTGKISADLYNVTFFEALDAILHVNGYIYQERGNFIYVYTIEEFEKIQKSQKQRVGKVIRLSYLNAVDAAEFVKPLLSQGADVKTTAKTEEFKLPDNVPTGKDDFALGAVIVVIDYEENIKAVEKLIAELDTKPAQVLVEATVMQTKVDEQNAFGIDFSIIQDMDFTNVATVGGPRAVADALGIGTGAGAGGGFSPPSNDAMALQSGTGKTSGKSTLKVGVISKNLAVILKLLDEVSDTTVMANPKLLVLNRQPARVQVIDRLAYISTTQTETSQTQTVQFLDTGVQLYFRPFVSSSGEIRMELKPQVSTGTTKEIKGTGGATVTVPDESRQEITTNVIVQDGMTIVLGGLFRESTVATRSQIPFLGDVPILGTPFRGHDDTVKREEIIFLVTPSLVNDKILLTQAERAVDVIDRVRAGTRQGLLPFSRTKRTSAMNVEADAAARAGNSERALYLLRMSLQMNPRQPDAWRLQERLVGSKELWPTIHMMDDIMREDKAKALMEIQPMPQPVFVPGVEHHFMIPRVPVRTEPHGMATPSPEIQTAFTPPSATPATPAQPVQNETIAPAAREIPAAPQQSNAEPKPQASAAPVAAPAAAPVAPVIAPVQPIAAKPAPAATTGVKATAVPVKATAVKPASELVDQKGNEIAPSSTQANADPTK